MKEKISITIEENILRELDALIDNIVIKNRSNAIEFLVNKALGQSKTAVILSGGSPDYLRISKTEFRPTAKINSKPLLQHNIDKLKLCGFKHIYIIARKPVLTAIFGVLSNKENHDMNFEFVQEPESRGTAFSLKQLKGKLNSPFIVLYGDIVAANLELISLWKSHIRNKFTATLLLTSSPEPNKKGVVELEGNRIVRFIQKPSKTELYIGFSSVFVAEPSIMDYAGDWLELDIFPRMAAEGLLGGFVSSQQVIHIHSTSDKNRASSVVVR